MKLIKIGKEHSIGGQTWRDPNRLLIPNVRCDGDGVPYGNKLCSDVYETPEKYPEYALVEDHVQ